MAGRLTFCLFVSSLHLFVFVRRVFGVFCFHSWGFSFFFYLFFFILVHEGMVSDS